MIKFAYDNRFIGAWELILFVIGEKRFKSKPGIAMFNITNGSHAYCEQKYKLESEAAITLEYALDSVFSHYLIF